MPATPRMHVIGVHQFLLVATPATLDGQFGLSKTGSRIVIDVFTLGRSATHNAFHRIAVKPHRATTVFTSLRFLFCQFSLLSDLLLIPTWTFVMGPG